MANKAISELPQALNVNNQDLFVLEQSGIAKKLTAETFITEQGIIDALAEALDGHGGIASVTLSSVSGRIRTYLITFTDGSATTFQVLDGTSITSIQKTSTAGLVDTYTVYMSDGTTSFFQVRNGQDGSATWDQINSKAPIITETVTGAIVNFPDGADDIPVADLVVDIEPVQDLNGYDNPWPAGGGKNKLPNIYTTQTINGVTFTVYEDGSIKVNGTASARVDYYLSGSASGGSLVLPEGNYTISYGDASLSTNGLYMQFQKNGTGVTISGSATFEAAELGWIRLIITSVGAVINNVMIYPMIRFTSVTDSTFQPYSNICPITGWTGCNVTRAGKNLFDESKYQNLPSTYEYSNETYHCKAIQLSPNTKYTVSHRAGTADSSVVILMNNVQKVNNGGYFDLRTASGSKTFTTDSTGCLYIGVLYSNDTAYNARLALCQIQIELGSTATTYESYQGSSVTVDWTTEAGTVYGGTLDVITGVLTVDAMLEVFNQITGDGIQSQIDYLPTTGVSTVGDYTRISFGIRSDIQRSDYNLVSLSYDSKMCNMLKHYFAYNDESSHWYRNTTLYAFFPSSLVGTTATSVISYLTSIKDTNPLSFWVPLTHPQTYQLTPQLLNTLLGTNNIWSDTGNTTAEYRADTKLYIEKLTMPTEDDLVANQAITSGKYFMIGNSLYLALANIASGAQITIGTNAQRVSLADALNTINA